MNGEPLEGHPDDDEAEASDGLRAADAKPEARPGLRKAPNAFRTISEVADDLHIPQHVLRFWETKFPQVKPLKRGGGRRYYRPDDIALLRRISGLLYVQGYTIKGVQRLLREGGGQLSDNIPPPAPEEKAGTEHDVADEPQLLMPGLAPAAPPKPLRPKFEPVRAASKSDAEMEVDRLRAALRETLRDLEALRALLG
jgi:DNA-binding transcriptional MerR regulator